MAVPKFLQSALWSCSVSRIHKSRDKGYIIPQILNHGSWDQIQWALKTYRPTTIKKYLKFPRRGFWHADNLRYWTTIYGVRPSLLTYQRALFSLTPTNLPLPRKIRKLVCPSFLF